MKKNIFLLFALFLFFASCSNSKEWTLVWEDNFDGPNAFDEQYWSKIPRGVHDWNNYMSDDPRLYDNIDGNLVLRGIVNDNLETDTAKYLTGGVYTKDKKNFGFGRLEIRAKLQGATGAWPAFWMKPTKEGWPHTGEIDIMERLNFDSVAYQTIHTHYTYNLGIKDNPKPGAVPEINPNDYNVYAVEKYPDSLVFYVNDKKSFTYPRIETDKEGQYPFSDHDFYLLLDMQLGGSWVGEVDPADLPIEMRIDWVRFYELK